MQVQDALGGLNWGQNYPIRKVTLEAEQLVALEILRPIVVFWSSPMRGRNATVYAPIFKATWLFFVSELDVARLFSQGPCCDGIFLGRSLRMRSGHKNLGCCWLLLSNGEQR